MAKEKGKAGLRVEIDVAARAFTINVKQGKEVLDSETFYMADCDDEIATRLQLQGASTICQQRNSEATDALEKLNGIRETWAMFCEGKFEKDRETGPRQVAPIIEVLANHTKKSIALVQKSWSKYPEASKEKLLKQFAEEIKAIEEARKADADGVDLDSLIEE